MSDTRISKLQLLAYANTLSDKQIEIVKTIYDCNYILTDQIRRLYFTGHSTTSSATRTTQYNLSRLKQLRLIDTGRRRIGGTRAGSGSYVWYVTSTGEKFLNLIGKNAATLHRRRELNGFNLRHTIALSECYVQLHEICRAEENRPKLTMIQTEPDCWRNYQLRGRKIALKPDLAAVTQIDGFEDRWFIEVDLATEGIASILEKCTRYHEYYKTNQEQAQHGVFPITVWIVPNTERKKRLCDAMGRAFKSQKLFTVICADELESIVCGGVKEDAMT